MQQQSKATIIGSIAIFLWSLLALFTVGTSPTPPFLLNALCFTLASGLGLIWTVRNGSLGILRNIDWRIYLFGTVGLAGYHALYFSALRLAPAAEAGLIAYLWPLLIVLFSGFLPGEKLKSGHLIGGFLGFGGAAMIISGGGTGFQAENLAGFASLVLRIHLGRIFGSQSKTGGNSDRSCHRILHCNGNCIGDIACWI